MLHLPLASPWVWGKFLFAVQVGTNFKLRDFHTFNRKAMNSSQNFERFYYNPVDFTEISQVFSQLGVNPCREFEAIEILGNYIGEECKEIICH